MSIAIKADGEYREGWSTHVKVNGEYRPAEMWSKVNGEWRLDMGLQIPVTEIQSFRLIYTRAEMKHPDHPLIISDNPNIPATLTLAPETDTSISLSQKGIIFEYSNDRADEEGLCMYVGTLFGILNNGSIIDLTKTPSNGSDERYTTPYVGIPQAWATTRIDLTGITIYGHELYEDNGYYLAGWNSLFFDSEFVDRSSDPSLQQSIRIMEHRQILKTPAKIGICRDLTTPNMNMVGSYGILDQTIASISINGEDRPFSIEIA